MRKSKRHHLLTYRIYFVLCASPAFSKENYNSVRVVPMIILGIWNQSVFLSTFDLRPAAQDGRQCFLEVSTVSSFSECFLPRNTFLENGIAHPLAYTFTGLRALSLRSSHFLLIIVLWSNPVILSPLDRWNNWGIGESRDMSKATHPIRLWIPPTNNIKSFTVNDILELQCHHCILPP